MEESKWVIYNETQNKYWSGGNYGSWYDLKNANQYSKLSHAKASTTRYIKNSRKTSKDDEIYVVELRVSITITDNKIKY